MVLLHRSLDSLHLHLPPGLSVWELEATCSYCDVSCIAEADNLRPPFFKVLIQGLLAQFVGGDVKHVNLISLFS